MAPGKSSTLPALDALRERLRRIQLIVGVGFVAAITGAVISASLKMRLIIKLPHLHSFWVVLLLDAAVSQLWVYAILPAFCYAIGRLFPVGKWSTPIGAAVTGEVFYLALDYLVNSFQDLIRQPSEIAVRAATLALGIYLGHRAVILARARTEKADAKAREAAKAKATQYDEFSKEAERIANLHADPPAPPAAPSTEPKPPAEDERANEG